MLSLIPHLTVASLQARKRGCINPRGDTPAAWVSANEEPEKIPRAGLTPEPPRWWKDARVPRFFESWIVRHVRNAHWLRKRGSPHLSCKCQAWAWNGDGNFCSLKKVFLLTEQSGTCQPWLMASPHWLSGTRITWTCALPSDVVCSDDIFLEPSLALLHPRWWDYTCILAVKDNLALPLITSKVLDFN